MSGITATQEGRNLHITFPEIDEPYVIKPLPATAGMQVTQTYLRIFTGPAVSPQEMSDTVSMVVDGGEQQNGSWIPRTDRPIMTRLESELSSSELHDVVLPALFWQTSAGMHGVRAWIEAGGGAAGDLAAVNILHGQMKFGAGASLHPQPTTPTKPARRRATPKSKD